MIQSIGNGYNNDENYYQLKMQNKIDDSSTVDESKVQTEQSNLQQPAIPKTDSVEISDAGRNSLAASKEISSSDSAKASVQMTSKTASTASTTSESATATSSSSTTPVLTSLTESQIEKLVSEGVITKAQANIELAKRKEKAEAISEKEQAIDAYEKVLSKDPLQLDQVGTYIDEEA